MIGKTVLVTGANGFLGRNIISCLLQEHANVRATDIGNTSATNGIAYHQADITKPEELFDAIGGAAIIIHAAGLAHIFSPDSKSNEKFNQINAIGTENVANAAVRAGVRHFILISSVSVYGPYTLGRYDENSVCRPVGSYALSKYQAELKAVQIARNSKMALTVLRLATLYGEGDPGNVGRLLGSLDKGRFLWIGDGSNRKSLLYKGDAARACQIVANMPALKSGVNIYNVSAPPCLMLDIVTGLSQALGKKPLPVQIPASAAIHLSKWFSLLPSNRIKQLHNTIQKWLAEDLFDTSRIEKDHGFYTKVSLPEGLKREVDWYRENHNDHVSGQH